MLNLALIKQFPGQTVAQYAQTILGSWIGKFVGMFYAITCLYLAASCIAMVTQVIKISIMQETPLWPFVWGFGLLTVYSAWLGIEPIARGNDLLLPFFLLVLLIVLIPAVSQGKLYQGLPVWQLNFSGIIKGSMVNFACLGEVFIILLLAPALNRPEQLTSATLKGLLISGLILMLISQMVLFILGVYRASVYLFPFLRVSQELTILDIFERFEPFVLVAWFIINVIKMSAFIYCFAISTVQTIQQKRYQLVLIPVIIILPLMVLFPNNLAETWQIWISLIGFQILLPLAFIVLPLILLTVAKVRKLYGR